ncbi:hypothetical protein [Paenibacillus sp. CAA11]|uniref:hypothetical protein n=1 Tax=Paenibacillus sp. CAA11 TaxID=1532905 RepID=UPI0018FF9148|nr:hypothetical protein [Paenibacillus sp. CAA11]
MSMRELDTTGGNSKAKIMRFCRNYDKKVEQKSKGIEQEEERTRVELVYRPDEKIPLENIIQYPP